MNLITPFVTEKEIEGIITELAQQINKAYEGSSLLMICPLKGPLMFFSDLCKKITVKDVSIDFILTQTRADQSICLAKDISADITHKDILIVEEVIDSGNSLVFLQRYLKLQNPRSVSIATLFDKPYYRTNSIPLDFTGKTIDDRFILGYGMDREEEGRSYPFVYTLGN